MDINWFFGFEVSVIMLVWLALTKGGRLSGGVKAFPVDNAKSKPSSSACARARQGE